MGISALGERIRATWTIGEILYFKSFAHGGTFSAPDGGWRIDYAGYVAATAQGMQNLVRLFDSLHAEAWAYMGAKCYADCKCNDTRIALVQDSWPYCGMTLTELKSTLPPPIVEMLQAIDANSRRGADAAEGALA